jgi:serine O-acetyltransferase
VKLTLAKEALIAYVDRLLRDAFPDGREHDVGSAVDAALARAERCFSRVALAGYRTAEGEASFNHLHGDQFATFLYLASNSALRTVGDAALAHKLSLLNRSRHALLIMPDTELPEIFVIPHTVGTVIGKASYADFLVVCQNVTVANDLTTHLTFEAGVVLFPGAFVVGTGRIGSGSVVAANATLQYEDVPPDTIVSGRSPDAQMRPRRRDFLARFFTPPYPGSDAAPAKE